MMRKIISLAVVLAAAGGSAHADAAAKYLAPSQRYEALHKFAACELGRNRALVVDFALDTMRGSTPGKYRAIGSERCVAAATAVDFNVARINADVLAGAVAEHLVGKVDPAIDARLATAPAFQRARLMTLADYQRDGWMTRGQFDKQVAMEAAERALDEAAECTVRRAPTASRAVFTAPFGTPAATAAIDALRSDLGACLGNAALRLTPLQLRGALALNYLRLAVGAEPSLKAKLI